MLRPARRSRKGNSPTPQIAKCVDPSSSALLRTLSLSEKGFVTVAIYLQGLLWWWCELGTKHLIPEATRNTKAVFVVHEVVLQVVLLQLLPVCW